VSSTKTGPQRDVEFVVGSGQVVKGVDRALQLMSVGERAVVSVTADVRFVMLCFVIERSTCHAVC
jgi:FKBP-type peptidyl-prolyl cis-trans isomerase 2